MTFSLKLSPDVIHIRNWVHEFAADVIRPAAAEWDEREETPWPIIQEAAKVGLYSIELFAEQASDPSGLGMLVVSEEMFWGDAGIGLSILGTGLAAASLMANGTPEQLGEWLPQMFGTVDDPKVGSFCSSEPAPALTSARSSPRLATTKPPTNGCSTGRRHGRPTAASPRCTSSSPRYTPTSAHGGRRRSSSRRRPRDSARDRSSSSTASAPRTLPRWCSRTSAFRAASSWAARRISTNESPVSARARKPRATPRWPPSSGPGRRSARWPSAWPGRRTSTPSSMRVSASSSARRSANSRPSLSNWPT